MNCSECLNDYCIVLFDSTILCENHYFIAYGNNTSAIQYKYNIHNNKLKCAHYRCHIKIYQDNLCRHHWMNECKRICCNCSSKGINKLGAEYYCEHHLKEKLAPYFKIICDQCSNTGEYRYRGKFFCEDHIPKYRRCNRAECKITNDLIYYGRAYWCNHHYEEMYQLRSRIIAHDRSEDERKARLEELKKRKDGNDVNHIKYYLELMSEHIRQKSENKS